MYNGHTSFCSQGHETQTLTNYSKRDATSAVKTDPLPPYITVKIINKILGVFLTACGSPPEE